MCSLECLKHRNGKCVSPFAGGGDATEERCSSCKFYVGPVRGAGDVVHRVLSTIGVAQAVNAIAPNCGCGERIKALNQIAPMTGDKELRNGTHL